MLQKERWDGAWLGPQAAREVFAADEVYPMQDLVPKMQQLAATSYTVLFDFDRHNSFWYQQLRGALQPAIGKGKMQGLKQYMHRLRWRKSAAELNLMQHSCTTAAHAIERCMQISAPNIHEATLAATFGESCLHTATHTHTLESMLL